MPVNAVQNNGGGLEKRGFALLAGILLASVLASAQNGAPAPRPNDQFSLMQLLADDGLHDIENESWNAYGQFTYISSWKPSFPAAYTNLNGSINSLLPAAERSFTGTATLYLGVRLWTGAEAYLVPEVISEQPLSQLRGLGGAIQNFELQKGGTETPQIYHSRLFVKQTFGFGGDRVKKESGPMQFGTTYDSRRLSWLPAISVSSTSSIRTPSTSIHVRGSSASDS